jgi:hypothetical protein
LESGWIVEKGDTGNYTLVVGPIYDTVTTEEVHIIPQWEDLRESACHSRKDDDFVRRCSFSLGQQKMLIERLAEADPDQSDRILLYVLSSAPFRYTSCKFRDEPGDPPEGEKNGYVWWGPFEDIADAQVALKRAYLEQFGGHSNMEGYEIGVSTTALEAHATQTYFDEHVDSLFKANLLWGFEQLGIATEDELYHPLPDDAEDGAKRKARISCSLNDGIILGVRGSIAGDEPVDWEANLTKSLERHQKQIDESLAAVVLLSKIADAVIQYGGWAKFKTDYRAKLVEAVRNQDAEGGDAQ